jgi:hypothetical protein
MKRWQEFASEEPEIAEAGRELIYQSGTPLGYLATIRKDGGPRLHPVCPVIAEGGLYVFIGNRSPKLHDLRRDGRFALHSFPVPGGDDEFYVSGRSRAVTDSTTRDGVHEALTSTGVSTSNDTLFELSLERVMLASYSPPRSWPPLYRKWSSD